VKLNTQLCQYTRITLCTRTRDENVQPFSHSARGIQYRWQQQQTEL